MRYKDFNISYYTSSNKKMPTNQTLTEIVHEINSIMFPIVNGYTTKQRTIRVGKAMNEIVNRLTKEQDQKTKEKREEIRHYLQTTIQQLRKAYNAEDNAEELQKTINYALSRAITFKNEEHTPHEIVDKLTELMVVKEDIGEMYKELNTTQFERVFDEIKENLFTLFNVHN